MLNLEEREEREGKRKVASDNELNFRFSSEYFSQPPLTVTLSRTWRKEKREKGEDRKWKDLYGYTKGPANAFGVVVEQNLSNDQEGLTPCF
ncbi:uncharacterized protein LOC126689298 isoform X3 [Quercus robur]|uniref:uncharacterized protein LOC126689298 isoform X3 n=1 Tax=Quercus robur TaxID=38942 RepID=UPI0021639950|nr:uncharacterized protein LOC126689298 isoform X3 [Quercus robur]